MTRDEEDRQSLAELLLRGDLSGVPVNKLVAAARLGLKERNERRDFAGKVAAQLHDTGEYTWMQIGELLGVSSMTAYRWAQLHL